MSDRPQKVQVFALGRPRSGASKAQRRWYVKWRVDGRDRTRAFKTRAEADRLRSQLLDAVRLGQAFDPARGTPRHWLDEGDGLTWWEWSGEWLELKWPQWSGNSRRSGVEALALIGPHMARRGAPSPPDGLERWLRLEGYNRRGGDVSAGPEMAWLRRYSIPLAEIDAVVLERTIRRICTRVDGTANVASVSRRRRNTLGAVLRSAVRRGLLPTNPMDRVEVRSPSRDLAVDVSTVPSPDEVEAIVDLVANMPSRGARYAALFACVGIAGMRPSEAIGLMVDDVELPRTGWGLARVRGAVTAPGRRYSADGSVVESKGLKHRGEGSVREVPIAPVLVERLRDHLTRWEPTDGRVFSNAASRPMTSTNYGPVWGRARRELWPAGHPLAKATVYDLRHSAATLMLRAGVPPAEVSKRLGHSVDVLLRVYAGVFNDERDRSNELIDLALGTTSPPSE